MPVRCIISHVACHSGDDVHECEQVNTFWSWQLCARDRTRRPPPPGNQDV